MRWISAHSRRASPARSISRFCLEMTTLDNGARYGANFLVADVGLGDGSLPGDYNNNGIVDAADYVVWRKTGTPPDGYNTWCAHFGQPAGRGTGSNATTAVPEPATSVLLMLAAVSWCRRRRRSTSKVSTTR